MAAISAIGSIQNGRVIMTLLTGFGRERTTAGADTISTPARGWYPAVPDSATESDRPERWLGRPCRRARCPGRRRSPRLPSSTSGGRKARAMPHSSIGEKFPLVTVADGLTRRRGRRCRVAGGRRPSQTQAPEPPGDAGLPLGLERRLAPELGVPPDDPAEAGLQRGDARAELVAVQRQPGLEPQRVAGAEAGRGEAGLEHRRPERRRDLGRDGALDAVLAGVAGAGDDALDALPLELARRRSAATCGRVGDDRRRAASRASGPGAAITARVSVTSSPPMAARTPSVFEAFGMTSKRSSSTHHTMMSSTGPSASSARAGGCTAPGRGRSGRRSLVSVAWSRSNASGPVTRTVPRCETSNATAPVRQARCSATVPSA